MFKNSIFCQVVKDPVVMINLLSDEAKLKLQLSHIIRGLRDLVKRDVKTK